MKPTIHRCGASTFHSIAISYRADRPFFLVYKSTISSCPIVQSKCLSVSSEFCGCLPAPFPLNYLLTDRKIEGRHTSLSLMSRLRRALNQSPLAVKIHVHIMDALYCWSGPSLDFLLVIESRGVCHLGIGLFIGEHTYTGQFLKKDDPAFAPTILLPWPPSHEGRLTHRFPF